MKLILIALLILPVLANAESQVTKVTEMAVPGKASMCDMLKYHLKPLADSKPVQNRRLPSGIKSNKNDSI